MVLSESHKGVLLAVFGSLLWGGSGVAGQFLFQERGMTAEWLVAVRMLLSGILLLTVDHFTNPKGVWSIWKDRYSAIQLLQFAVLGMLGVQYTYFAAIEASNAATGTVMQYFMPVIIIVWMSLRNRKLPPLFEGCCVVLAVVGTILLVTHGDITVLAISEKALFWGILTAFAAAFYTVQPHWLMLHWSSTQVIGWGMLIGAIPLAIMFPPLYYPGVADMAGLLSLAYLIIFGTAIAFWSYVTSTKYITPQDTSIINAVEPMSSVVLSVLLLNVNFGYAELLGTIMIIVTAVAISWKNTVKNGD